MYNKIFTKILDSSIWLETTPTRIVWLTLIAQMDEDGYAHFSAIGNLASRARVTNEEALKAIKILTSPDSDSGDPDNDGRRVERVPGGYLVLNAPKYRDIFKREKEKEQNRIRVARYRDRQKLQGPPLKTENNVTVTPKNATPKREAKPPPDKASEDGIKATTADVWQAYSDAYYARYKADPVRNARVNSQLLLFVSRVGKDEAPGIAAFYVSNNNQFYVTRGHPVGLLLSDAEKLRTEWATNQQVMQTQAQHTDQRQSTANSFQKLLEKADDREEGPDERE